MSMSMSALISLLNDFSVSFFGSFLSAAFCDAFKNRKKRWMFWCYMVVMPLLQGGVYLVWNAEVLRQIYPVVVHLPLFFLLWLMTGKRLWPLISILSAYLCCELRRWLALLVVAVLQGGDMMQDICELFVTVPLLLLLHHFFSPVIRPLSASPVKRQCIFGLVPAVYYLFDYGTRVYTDVLYSGGAAAVEFMPFVCCLVYMAFLIYHSTREQTENELQQVKKSLDIQLTQAVREINALRESQTLAIQYRHDLRHHLQYLSACLENGQTEQARAYISGICEEIESQKVRNYCENETANLILSSFAGRARQAGIAMKIQGRLPAQLPVSDSDLCVLLSNALENALHACQPFADANEPCDIDVQVYERESRIFLQVTNSCKSEVRFEQGLPVSDRAGHGIGVQSICAIVQKYNGVCTFLTKDDRFILRLSL